MVVFLSRAYIVLLLLAAIALFFVTPQTRDYALQAFNAGDSAYHFYDDFPLNAEKPVILFQCLMIASFILVFPVIDRERLKKQRLFFHAVYSIGAVLILAFWQSAILVVLGLFCFSYPWRNPEIPPRKRYWLLAALFVIALLFRLEKLPNVTGQPLQPDSVQYVHYAQESEWFYDTNHREPLWAWVNYGLSCIVPVPETVDRDGYLPIRIFTILLSSFCVIAVYAFGKRWISPNAGFAAALLMATNKAFIYRSLQGLRLELFILAILGFLWLAWLPARSPKTFSMRTVGLGLAGAVLLLLRSSCLPIVVFSLFWAFWSKKQSPLQILTALAICMFPVAPYYYYCWSKYGDPLYSGNAHIRFYYHAVFGEYPEQRISPYQFMFHLFSWHQSILYSIVGTLDTFAGRYALRLFYIPISVIPIGCSLAGYMRWLWIRERRIIAVSTLLLLGPMAFFLGILLRSDTVFDWRLLAHLFPFMAYAGYEGFIFLMQQAQWMTDECGTITTSNE